MSFKIKDGLQIGAKNVFNNTGQLVAPIEVDDPNTAFTLNLGLATNLTGDRTINFPNATGTVALGTINDGTLGASAVTAGSTNTTVAINFSGSYSANTANNITINPVVGPALTNLAALMTTAGAGFIRRGATADTYTIDTNTYLTAEADTLATVTGRGATTSTATTFFGGLTTGGGGIIYNGSTSGSTTLKAAATAGTTTITMPATTGTMALTSDINNGTLGASAVTAGSTNTTVAINFSGTYSANTASNITINPVVGPALTALATTMTGAGTGFLRKNGADTYTLDTNTYLTAEADTLATVTGRGATTASAVSITNNTASTTTGTGALTVTGGVGVGGAVNIGGAAAVGGNLTITGNLIVNGTTTTVNSTTTTLDDPILTLGGDTAAAADDNKDRGVEFRWHNGSAAKIGFFGFDDSTGKFTFIPDATNSSEVFAGTTGELDAKIDWSNVLNAPTVTPGNGALTLTAGAGATNTSVTIGTGTGFSANTASNVGYSISVGPALTNLATLMTTAGAGFIRRGATADTYTIDTNTYLTAEADTLATVTGRGATSSAAITLTNTTESTTSATGGLILNGGLGVAKNITTKAAVKYNTGADVQISETSATGLQFATTTISDADIWAAATYRSARYLLQITQGSAYQVSEILVLHNGTTTTMTEYAVLESNSPLATFTSDISSGNVRLRITMASVTLATLKLHRTLITV